MQEKSENQQIHLPLLSEKQVYLSIKREDLIHPSISGNKFRKLKYNLIEAKQTGLDTILTFGGAFSNHIAATAYAGQLHGFKTIGIIRGEELSEKWDANPTLKMASNYGMQFKFISRDAYRNRDHPSYSKEFSKELRYEFGSFYLLPEGGTNALAIRGCEEILNPSDANFDTICCSVGTGGTVAGIINSSFQNQQVLGFPALKGDFINQDIRKFAPGGDYKIVSGYHFGGYAKVTAELIDFINGFKAQTRIPLDPVYTGKMVFGILDLIEKNYFEPGSNILAIHTGGLQGIVGMNPVLKRKNLPLLSV
ncbi:MAG: pyridoxal-phosphate dependent enzyme [Pricia sp.]